MSILLLPGCAGRTLPANHLDEKIGQMLMVGFRGQELDSDHFIVKAIRRQNLGGVILFDYDVLQKSRGRNIASPSQLKGLIATLQNLSDTRLIVAIDQEGGLITRLKNRDGFPETVSHLELGRRDDLHETFVQADRLAATLAELGIELNLAPVVDLCINPGNPVIARLGRCFSAVPQKVAAHASAYIEAHHRNQVLTTLKHFPGHGSSRTDSHQGFTDVTDTWNEAELIPYRRLIASGEVDAIMTAHVYNARLDVRHPATLSRATIDGLLREQLGFSGVVISDDLQMGAIVDHYGFETAIRKAIQAGVDILVFGNNLHYDEQIVPRAIAAVKKLVRDGVISEQRIDASYRRIMRLKNRLGEASAKRPRGDR